MEPSNTLASIKLSNEYRDFLIEIKTHIKSSQLAADSSVNRHLVELYWELGRLITLKQASQQWGEGVAVDAQLKHPQDPPSIGLILCKTKDNLTAEYALQFSTRPIGVADYQVVKSLPQEYVADLPTVEELTEEFT